MIVEVNSSNISEAAAIHSESWKESHISFCNTEFIEMHTTEHQEEYLRNEIQNGKKLFMLIEDKPVGIISVKENIIENLYILPSEQRKGYGTKLLTFAVGKCIGVPALWILNNNIRAYNLYSKYGFRKTGNVKKLSDSISEIEMIKMNCEMK